MVVAVGALHPMNVVRTLRIEVGGIHSLHVEFAFAPCSVAGGAGGSSIFVVPVVARNTTEPLMHAGWGVIVACSHLRT